MTTIDVYNKKSDEFHKLYLSKTSEEIHKSWLSYLPISGQALDIGAGIGRDAKWLALNGFEVVAVEPAENLRALGQNLNKDLPVLWIDDSLPALAKVIDRETHFDLILLSAVWMHVPKSERDLAFRRLSELLNPAGILVITLRHGTSPDEREMYPVSSDELSDYALRQGLVIKQVTSDTDKLNRPDVYWETVVISNDQ